MKKSKHCSVALCLGVLLSAGTADAFFPVFDFQEIVPVSKDVKTGADTITDLKKQISEMNQTLNAIGKETNTIANFSQNISAMDSKSAGSAADNAGSTSSNSANAADKATSTAANSIKDTVDTQKNMVDDYVNQTQQAVGIKNDAVKMRQPAPVSISYLVEEEEEEEEVTVSNVVEEISQLQEETLNEQKQMAVELNDVLEAQLTALHTSIAENIAAFNELDETLQNMSQIKQEDRNRLHTRILEILQKQRETGDWAARIVESAKENYNREYNNVIKDGINNYTKKVVAYMNGDANKESVIEAGNQLKKDVEAINVTPDAGVLSELKKTSESVNKEVESMVLEIKGLLNEN